MVIYSRIIYSKENFIFVIIVRNVKVLYVILRKFRFFLVEYEVELKDEFILEDFVNCYYCRMFIGFDISFV